MGLVGDAHRCFKSWARPVGSCGQTQPALCLALQDTALGLTRAPGHLAAPRPQGLKGPARSCSPPLSTLCWGNRCLTVGCCARCLATRVWHSRSSLRAAPNPPPSHAGHLLAASSPPSDGKQGTLRHGTVCASVSNKLVIFRLSLPSKEEKQVQVNFISSFLKKESI